MTTAKCSARKPNAPTGDVLSFVKGIFDNSPCPNNAAYHGPEGRPLCESCALERKKAHEDGETIIAIYQREKLGRIDEYRLRPIDQTPEEAEKWLREQGVNVERFLERTYARMRETFAGLTERERKVMRMRFADDPKTLATLDETESETD
jgi:hypothetical protein